MSLLSWLEPFESRSSTEEEDGELSKTATSRHERETAFRRDAMTYIYRLIVLRLIQVDCSL